eukprot:417403-Alexandrium_andersonii.AAC.1
MQMAASSDGPRATARHRRRDGREFARAACLNRNATDKNACNPKCGLPRPVGRLFALARAPAGARRHAHGHFEHSRKRRP